MINRLLSAFFYYLLLLGLIYTQMPAFGGPEPPIERAAPKIPERQRYLAIVIYNYETNPEIDDERIENAGRIGCNAAEISIHWDQVYPTRNSAPNWRVVDSHVNTAVRMGMKVALRIHTAREPRFLNGFWGDPESMLSADNALMHFGGAVQFSFAHQPTLELAKDFVRQVTQRYQYLQQQDNLLFMSVTASPIQEGEYSPRNGRGDGSYAIPFDYGDPMKQGFRQWLQGRFSLEALNRRWNSDFSRWEAVVPPPYNQHDPYNSFNRGYWGRDWYVFRHIMLKRFFDETNRTIKEVNGSIQVVNQHGSVWDRQSGLRGTFAFKSLAQNADGVKVNDGPDYNHRFSMDVVRSNIRPGAWVCNEVDGMYSGSVSVQRFYEQIEDSYERGASMILLANFGSWGARGALNELVGRVVKRGLLSQPVTQVQTASSTTYKLSAMVKDDYSDPEGRASDQWAKQDARNGRKPVHITINEDWLQDDANQDPRVREPISNQTAYVEKPFEFSIPTSTFEDPDGSITKVEITSGLPALGLSVNGVTISGTPNTTGTITVTVRAIDNKNSSVSTQFQINVQGKNANQAPVVSQSIDDRTALVGQDYSFKIPNETFKDPDGRIVGIEVTNLPGGLAYNSETYTISGKPTNEGVSTITLKATDDKGTSVSTSFKLTITKQEETNKPPVVSNGIPNQTATAGQNFSYTIPNATFSDPDGQIIGLEIFGLTNGLSYDADSRTIKGTPTTAGNITVKVKAIDNKGASVSTEFRLTINNSAPVEQLAILEPTVDCSSGEIRFRTSGGDGTKVEFRVVGIAEDWTNNTTFVIDPWLRNGVTFEIQARQSGKEIKFAYTTPCKEYTPPIVANPMSDQTYQVGQFFILRIPPATFQSSTPLAEVTVSALPEGTWYDKVTRAISGTPSKTGSTTITVTAIDERGAKVEDVFVMTIIRGNSPLVMLAPTLNCESGKLTIRTEGGDGSALTYSIEGIAGWNSNPVFTIGSDKLNGAKLKVLARQGDREISYNYTTNCTAMTLPDQTIFVGQAYTYTLPDPGANVTFTVSGLPEGLNYNAANRTIAGIPSKTGTTTLTIKAIDDKGNEKELTFKLIVIANTPPVVKGNFEGFLDGVNCRDIAGWVWDQDRPNTPVTIEFLTGSNLATAQVVGTVTADVYRKDLKDAGKGNGSHGYRWDTAEELKTNQSMTVWGRVVGTNYLLNGSPKTLSCPGSGPPPTSPGNQPPVAPVVAAITAVAKTAFQSILPVFTDSDGDALTYAVRDLPAGVVFNATRRELSGTVSDAGRYPLTYSATDTKGAQTSVEIILTINPQSTNPPVVVKGNFEGFLDGVNCRDIAGWVWDQDRPNTPVTIEFLTGSNLATAQVVGTVTADVYRKDLKDAGKGNGSHGYRWDTAEELKTNQSMTVWGRVVGTNYLLKGSPKTLSCPGSGTPPSTSPPLTGPPPTSPGNQPPVAPVVAAITAVAKTAFQSILPVFTDSDGDALTYAVRDLPAGVVFNATRRELSGTVSDAGRYPLTYSATDTKGAQTSVEIILTINPQSTNPSNPALVVLAPEYDCQTGKITFRTSGGDNTQIEYKAAGITEWTSNPTHTISSSMRKGATFEIEVRQSQKVVKYNYTTACVNGEVAISDQVITQGLFYTFTIPEVAADVRLEVSGLPKGISFNTSNRAVSGKPTEAGVYTVTVKSTNASQQSQSTSFKLTVREPYLTVQLIKAGNAAIRQVIQEMKDNGSARINNLPDKVNFFCTSNVPVGSITFQLTGSVSNNNVDSQAPFGLFGDDDGFKPQVGAYLLRVAAFTGANGSGEMIVNKNVTFSFVPGGGRISTPVDNAETAGEEWLVYPNPVQDVINLTIANPLASQTETATSYRFSLSSTTGSQWELQENSIERNQQKVILNIQTLQLPTGMYFLQIRNRDNILKVIKVLKQ